MSSLVRLVRLTALCCAMLACSSQPVEAQNSAARVVRKIEVLRGAPNAAKARALADLVALGCSGPDVCETRAVCQAAYELHVGGLALTQAAKLRLSDGNEPEAAKLLSSAEQKLSEASRRVADCTAREAALRHRYKL